MECGGNGKTPALPPLQDSGERRAFATGSRRDRRTGKGRFDLLPARALRRLARHFEAGAVKYGDRNWEKGQPLSVYLDSALRHANTYMEGKTDEDHLIAAAWNLLCLADTEERIKEGLLPETLNDLPKEAPPAWEYFCLVCGSKDSGTGEPPIRCRACRRREADTTQQVRMAINAVAGCWHCGSCGAGHAYFPDLFTIKQAVCPARGVVNQL